MELTVMGNEVLASYYDKVKVAGKGYYKDVQIILCPGDDLTYFYFGKNLPQNENLFPADTEETVVNLKNGGVLVKGFNTGIAPSVIVRSDKKIYVDDGDHLNVLWEKSGSANTLYYVIQATFVPVVGHTYKIMRAFNTVPEDLAKQAIQVPFNGRLVKSKISQNIIEATDDFIHRVSMWYHSNEVKDDINTDITGSADNRFGDADIGTQNNDDYYMGVVPLHQDEFVMDAAVSTIGRTESVEFHNEVINKGDFFVFHQDLIVGSGLPDTMVVLVELDLVYKGDNENMEKGTYHKFVGAIADEIIDLSGTEVM